MAAEDDDIQGMHCCKCCII